MPSIGERAELAERLSLLANAPRMLVGQLARENEILVAGPLLRRSPVLDERALLDIASAKGQGHLLALSERPALSTTLTDVIIRRGDREVVRRAAGNAGAQFSESGFSELVRRANWDGVLTLTVGQRHDLSDRHLKELLARSLDVVRRRLFEVAKPERKAEIKQAIAEMTELPSGRRTAATSCRRNGPFCRCTPPAASPKAPCWVLPKPGTTRKRSPRSRRCRG